MKYKMNEFKLQAIKTYTKKYENLGYKFYLESAYSGDEHYYTFTIEHSRYRLGHICIWNNTTLEEAYKLIDEETENIKI